MTESNEATLPKSKALAGKRIVDLSTEIYTGMPVFPGHQRTSVFEVKTHEEMRSRYGKDSLTTTTMGVLLSDHGPTHTDAFSHFDPSEDSESIEEMPLYMFYTEAICVDATQLRNAEDYLSKRALRQTIEEQELSVQSGDTVLLHTGHWNRNWGTEDWLHNYGGLTREATEWLADEGVVNIGVDAPSIDSSAEMGRRERREEDNYPAHQVCKEQGITNTENLTNLDKVSGERFIYIGFPLSIRGGSGSPVRAVGIVEEA